MISFTYDNNGNQLTIIDSTGTTTRTYDELGRVLTKAVPMIGTSIFDYDITSGIPEGYTKETSIDPKGHTVARVYDKVGRMVNVIADGKTTTYSYYDNGSKESVVYSYGSREDYTYYKDNLNKTLTNKKSDGTIIDTYSYTYDGAHNQTSKTDAKGVTTYTYDSVNRLESVTEPSGTVTKYSYDKAGNRLTQVVTKDGNSAVTIYIYNEQNRLLNVTTVNAGVLDKTVYTYDNNGNTLSSAKSTIKAATGANAGLAITAAGSSTGTELTLNQYDVRNQLVKTIVGDKTITNTYNGEGYRVAKAVNGVATNYLYESDKVILEVDGSGTEKARNVYGTNLVSRTVEGQTLSYMYNGHADVVALLDNSGNIVGTYYYDAFGNIVEQTGDANNSITYAGYQYDKETGLYYLNARMYDPVTARFLQEDTYRGSASDPLSLNLYTYCSNSPIMYWDPTGHWQTGDEYLTVGARYAVSRLTDLYFYFDNTQIRSAIASKMKEVRGNDPRQRNANDGTTGGKFYKWSDKNNVITKDNWFKNVSTTYDHGAVQTAKVNLDVMILFKTPDLARMIVINDEIKRVLSGLNLPKKSTSKPKQNTQPQVVTKPSTPTHVEPTLTDRIVAVGELGKGFNDRAEERVKDIPNIPGRYVDNVSKATDIIINDPNQALDNANVNISNGWNGLMNFPQTYVDMSPRERGGFTFDVVLDLLIAKAGAKAYGTKATVAETGAAKQVTTKVTGEVVEGTSKTTSNGGVTRAVQYSKSWGNASMKEVVSEIAPGSSPIVTDTGKVIYNNVKTGKQVVYDIEGNYFRIEDTMHQGKRVYLDVNGNTVPNNKVVNGKQIGISQGEYNQTTHFNNTDTSFPYDMK